MFSQNTSTKGGVSSGGIRLPPQLQEGQHEAADLVGVALRITLELGGDGVRAEKGEGDIHRGLVVERQQGFEQTQFRCGLQAVAGLGFDGGRAVGEHAQKARAGLGDERLDAGGARGADGGDDSAAGCQDVEVLGTFEPHLVFLGPVAAPDDVRVRVDETGHDHAAGGVQRRLVGVGGAQFGGGAHCE